MHDAAVELINTLLSGTPFDTFVEFFRCVLVSKVETVFGDAHVVYFEICLFIQEDRQGLNKRFVPLESVDVVKKNPVGVCWFRIVVGSYPAAGRLIF